MEPPSSTPPGRREHVLGFVWWKLLLGGFALWLFSVIVTAITHNFNLVPTVVLLGSFLIPVSAVAWYVDHYRSEDINPTNVFKAFIVGGVLGVAASSILEAWLLIPGPLGYLGVGLIEEAAKLVALWFIARRLPVYGVRDGVVLGSAVGFGFAALESSGYAFAAMIQLSPHGVVFSLPSLVFTELIRGVLAPFGHGLWTGILGGVLFGAARGGRLQFSRGVMLAYLAVSALHGLWDSMRGIAAVITAILSAGQTMATSDTGVPDPTADQVFTFLTVESLGLAIIALVGVAWLVTLWRAGAGRAKTVAL